ncbi:DUF3908 family protein [Bacillus pseudomycoides]|uniref:DUF3908 family protein n=1 Tax=Bacillus bingmayongensis TaxID=1150157 RepID=A0ABU5JZ38_9BACI|nr:DUF3908 family protein [Bacillus pseudomycoides]
MDYFISKDGFRLKEIEEVARVENEDYFKIVNKVKEYHSIAKCKVVYPKNLLKNKNDIEILFFFDNYLVIGMLDEDKNVVMARLKYDNITEVKMWFRNSPEYGSVNAALLIFNTGKEITLDSLKDADGAKIRHYVTKIDNIYSII